MNKTEAVNEFLTKVFNETLTVDLKDMLSISRGLDFGIIILVCSGIELLGALNQGHLRSPTNRFTTILREYFPSGRDVSLEKGTRENRAFHAERRPRKAPQPVVCRWPSTPPSRVCVRSQTAGEGREW
jgi:hypothetical protein